MSGPSLLLLFSGGGVPLSSAELVLLSWATPLPILLRWGEPVAAQLNWEMYLGEDVTPIVFREVPGGPITGWTIAVTFKNAAGSPVITKTATISDGPDGVFSWTMAHADTAGLPAGDYTYDCRRTDSGAVTELLIGRLTLLQPVGGP